VKNDCLCMKLNAQMELRFNKVTCKIRITIMEEDKHLHLLSCGNGFIVTNQEDNLCQLI
jgi:hypothetical protein